MICFFFVSHQSGKQFLRYRYFKIWHLKIQDQGHRWGQSSYSSYSIQSMHFLFVSRMSNRVIDLEKTHLWKKKKKKKNRKTPKTKENLKDLIAATGQIILQKSSKCMKSSIFGLCDLEIWKMTSKNDTIVNRFHVPKSYVFHLTAICEFRLELSSRNAQIEAKSAILVRVTLKFDGWPWKTIEHLFYALSSSVHHFVAVCEFKQELQSGTPQFGSKSSIFVWPWNLIDDLEKHRAPVLCLFKRCALFRSHLQIQTAVTAWKRSIRVKIINFLAHVPLKFDRWPKKTTGYLFYALQALCIIS